MSDTEHSETDTARAAGAFLATHFAKCLAAEVDGRPAPDPYAVLDDDPVKITAALEFIGGLLGTCDCPTHRRMLQRFLAALADMIRGQGAEMELFVRTLHDTQNDNCVGRLVAHLSPAGNVHFTGAVEMPQFSKNPHEAGRQAEQAAHEVLRAMVQPITRAVFTAAGFDMADAAE